MKIKKKPLREFAQADVNGTKYTIILHGRLRKRVIVCYMYWDSTGGLNGWENCTIFDKTFQSEDEARPMFEHYQTAENLITLRSKFKSYLNIDND